MFQHECAALFGNPSTPGWGVKHIARVEPPWKLMMGDIPIHSIKVNSVAAPSLTAIIGEIWDKCGHDQKQIAKVGMDVFSGDWAIRQARGLRMVSMHAYALAVDFNAPKNPLGWSEPRTLFKHDSLPVVVFKAHGWTWGGDWTGRRDAMHFQFPKVG